MFIRMIFHGLKKTAANPRSSRFCLKPLFEKNEEMVNKKRKFLRIYSFLLLRKLTLDFHIFKNN